MNYFQKLLILSGLRGLRLFLIFLGLVPATIVLIVVLFIIITFYSTIRNHSFCDIEVPEDFSCDTSFGYFFDQRKLDSLRNLQVDSNQILVFGDRGSYDFYFRYRPVGKGELKVKAYEITSGRRISRWAVTPRTKVEINGSSDEYELYMRQSVISEGCWEEYFPVRFELWFKPTGGRKVKVAEKNYMIEGGHLH